MVVIGLGKNLLFKSVLANCEPLPQFRTRGGVGCATKRTMTSHLFSEPLMLKYKIDRVKFKAKQTDVFVTLK